MKQIGVFDNKNVAVPRLPKRDVLPPCVCNYNAINVSNGILNESKVNSSEQRSITLTERMSVQTDQKGRKYIDGANYPYGNAFLDYNDVADNPFNIGLGDLAQQYGVNFTLVARGRFILCNRTYTGWWSGYNNYFLVGKATGQPNGLFFIGTGTGSSEILRTGIDDDIISIRATTSGVVFTNHTTGTVYNGTLNVGGTLPGGTVWTETDGLSRTFIIGGTSKDYEQTDFKLYWMYYSKSQLTDDQINRVIHFNEQKYVFTGLTMTSGSNFTVSFSRGDRDLQYRIDDGVWTNYDIENQVISVPANSKLYWKRNNNTVITEAFGKYYMGGSGISLSGNLMSLLDGGNYAAMKSLEGWGGSVSTDGIFASLFTSLQAVTSASGLILPATTLAPYCYFDMFANCQNLGSAPALPAMTLAEACYAGMYQQCYSLVNAPLLPAPTLVDYCYANMYSKCVSMNSIRCMADSGFNTTDCLQYFTSQVAATGTFTKKAGITWPSGTSGIPSGWTVIEA